MSGFDQSGTLIEGRKIVAVIEDAWDQRWWVRLNNGLELAIEYREVEELPCYFWAKGDMSRLTSLTMPMRLLGLSA